MKIYLRVCPFVNGKSPLHKDDKLAMFGKTLSSVVRGFRDIKPEIIFVLDSCPVEYERLVKDIPFKSSIVRGEKMGNLGSFRKQLELASKADDCVLLLEDDYIFLPDVGKKLLAAMESFDFVTPYDHPDLYWNEPRHIGEYEIKVVGGHHWREVRSTTLTFGCHSSKLKEHMDTIIEHEIWDYPMWQEIRANGSRLWGPIPSLATHLVEDLLAPVINWEEEWLK